ncbi:hypothetical protein [Methanobacterium sp.]|uniref:hypothetical protein n=1 Tax=Methanobacterium sp. TaxID=2164 RepID=UPI0025F7B290|nr:hypothetical protein [Methanobacterium sp.]MBI5459905.1 hypothetical protein [Methanobacterium sp.]MDY9923197.1 hypothetical protein [Methanobacterium sp.]
MLSSIAYYPILGKPLILYLGIVTLLSFIITATIGLMIYKGKKIPFKIHPTMAGLSLILGITHGTLALSVYLLF